MGTIRGQSQSQKLVSATLARRGKNGLIADLVVTFPRWNRLASETKPLFG